MAPHDPLNAHSHDPNLTTPDGDGSFELYLPNGRSQTITVADLETLPVTAVSNCYIVSTGHGTSGPFTFCGATLAKFISHHWQKTWATVEVKSIDGFGNQIMAEELSTPIHQPIMLAYQIDKNKMSRQEGLVRLIVPSETEDALRQVKWIGEIHIRS